MKQDEYGQSLPKRKKNVDLKYAHENKCSYLIFTFLFFILLNAFFTVK